MKPWSHLANAHHIDWVIESLKADPEKWVRAYSKGVRAYSECKDGVELRYEALDTAWNVGTLADRGVALDAIHSAMLETIQNANWGSTGDVFARSDARGAVWESLMALVAYDDCDQYLQMSYEQLLIYATLSERPQAVLLLRLKWVQEHEALVASR